MEAIVPLGRLPSLLRPNASLIPKASFLPSIPPLQSLPICFRPPSFPYSSISNFDSDPRRVSPVSVHRTFDCDVSDSTFEEEEGGEDYVFEDEDFPVADYGSLEEEARDIVRKFSFALHRELDLDGEHTGKQIAGRRRVRKTMSKQIPDYLLPRVAIIGRPNVGKSALFNRLVGGNLAIVVDEPGVTRDRLYGRCFWGEVEFMVVDTGGVLTVAKSQITVMEELAITTTIGMDSIPLASREAAVARMPTMIEKQAAVAVEEASVVIFLVDGQAGLTAADVEIADWLRKNHSDKKIILGVNKCESPRKGLLQASEFWSLGFSPIPISAISGTGTGELLDIVCSGFKLNEASESFDKMEERVPAIAIVGRPNVGKSSILNALLGEDRTIVSPISGTTRDAIDTEFTTTSGQKYCLIDTAGVRRRAAVASAGNVTEMLSVNRAFRAVRRADIVALVIEAMTCITEQDTVCFMELEGDPENETQVQPTKKRRLESDIWKYFDLLPKGSNGEERCKCKKCPKVYLCSSKYGTKNMHNHFKRCVRSHTQDIGQLIVTRSSKALGITSKKFNEEHFRELLSELIIRHNLPFLFVEWSGFTRLVKYLKPDAKIITRNTCKADCRKLYVREKTKVKELLHIAPGRIHLTSDCWSSLTSDGYICLTAHFIDKNWKLQKRILNFCYMHAPHNGVSLAGKILSLLISWEIDTKIGSITLDNASANNVSVESLKLKLKQKSRLLSNGDYFHIRCCAHIVNLVVQDGLKEINVAIEKIRSSIKYVKSSQARKEKFFQSVSSSDSKKGLRQDVETRWNSTYIMLESAIYYRSAFEELSLSDDNYKTCPTSEEWEKI